VSAPLLRAVLWVHPLLALATVGVAMRQASLGLRGRVGGPGAAARLAQHRRLGPWLLGLVVVNWLIGLGSVRIDPRHGWRRAATSGRQHSGCCTVSRL
jgi:hypothetical protein